MSLFTSFIFFHTIVMNFVLTLLAINSQQYDYVLNVINKFFRRILPILENFTFNVAK